MSRREITLYQAYLTLDRVQKLVEKAGGEIHTHEVMLTFWPESIEREPWFYWHYPINVWISSYGSDPETREEFVARLIENESLSLTRNDGQMYVHGKHGAGEIPFLIRAGEGVCERVVVGTRKVMKPDPSAPLVEVEEEITEIRCPDPILAAGLA